MIDYTTFDFAAEAAAALRYAQANEPEVFADRYVRAIWLDYEWEQWHVVSFHGSNFIVARNQLNQDRA